MRADPGAGEQIRETPAEEYLKDKSRETKSILTKILTEVDGKEKWTK